MKPLEGIKVLELATLVAAPAAGRLLGDMGADVIKIESLDGDIFRNHGPNYKNMNGPDENIVYDVANVNKRYLALNLKTENGMSIFKTMLKTADVFITNFRTLALRRLGLTYEQLKDEYPELVWAQALGYGEKGPDKDKPGYDFTCYYARGGMLGNMQERGSAPIVPFGGFGDFQCATAMYGGILAALIARNKTGCGDKVTVSLHHMALYTNSLMLVANQYGKQFPASRSEATPPTGNTYKTKDGRWVYIANPNYDATREKIFDVLEINEYLDDPRFQSMASMKATNSGPYLVAIIDQAIAKKDMAEWEEIFTTRDIAYQKALLFDEILEDPQAWENDCFKKVKYKTGNERILVVPPVKMESVGIPEFNLSKYCGEDTEEILKEYGIDDAMLIELREQGVIK